MNKHLFTITLIFSVFITYSQDILKRKDGTELQVLILNKEGNEIEYKLFNFQSGQSFKINKNDVLYLQTATGNIERFDLPFSTAKTEMPSNTPASSSSDLGSRELSQTLKKLNSTLENLSKTQNSSFSEVITQLNNNIVQLKEITQSAASKNDQQSAEIINRLTTLNQSVDALKETSTNKQNEEILMRKFGIGVNFNTNYLFSAFDDSEDELVEGGMAGYKGLFLGAGLNLIISTRMNKKVGFRYEPEFSIASRFKTENISGATYTTRSSIFGFGSRFLAVIRRNRVNIYTGPSLIFFSGVLQGTGKSPGVKTSMTTANFGAGFGLHFGGEYLIHSNFGINLESGMQLFGLFPKKGISSGVFSTYARLGGRFYF